MTSFTISDSHLEAIKDQVVIVTGASSGIGLATVKRLPEKSQVPFLRVDVTSWKEQLALFKAAKEKYGNIDHVFANAGIQHTSLLLEEDVDENGDLLPPKLDTINVNLLGCMYTTKLGIHYIKQNPNGGSIVLTGSATSFRRFSATDYTTSKHGVLGLLRSLHGNLFPTLPIRINAIAPSWTETAIIPKHLHVVQSADVVARSAILRMADTHRHGQMICSIKGTLWDIENGENGLGAYSGRMLGESDVGRVGG